MDTARGRQRALRQLWIAWPLGVATAVVVMVLVLSPWSGVDAGELAAYRGLYQLIEMSALAGIVVGAVRARPTAAAAWTALIVVVLTTMLNTALSISLPASAGYGHSGLGLVLSSAVFVVMGVSSLAVPALLLRARLGGRRDRAGMVDAMAIAAAVGIVLWDVLVLAGPRERLGSAAIVGALGLAVAVSGTLALLIRLAFTGIAREPAAQLMVAAGLGATVATMMLGAGGGANSVGAVWSAEVVELLSLGLAAGATLHPSALRLGRRAVPGELDTGIGQGRLAVLAAALLVPTGATVVRSLWLAHGAGGGAAPARPEQLLPSSLAALIVTAAVIWRMWQLLHEREDARRSLRHHATHDDLTGLPNRRALREMLRERVSGDAGASGALAPFALLFLDLDGFKAINDALGHEAGDAVLVEVAVRVRAALRDDDVLTRPSGDEFVALCEGPVDQDVAREIAARIHECIVAPIMVRGVEVTIGASIGVALPPPLTGDGVRDAERLMRLADHAMYDAKRAGGRRTVLAHDGGPGGDLTP